MNKRFIHCILAVLTIFGCQVKETGETVPGNLEHKVFTATIEDNATGETKTYLNAGGNVLWKHGDQVSIFAGSAINEQYQVSDESDGKRVATLDPVPGSGFVAGSEIDNNVAFYPYAPAAELSNSGNNYTISNISLPATQYYAEESFGNGAFPMVAVTSSAADKNLKFKNVLGGLKLQLKGTAKIVSLSIYGNGDEVLCGTAEVTAANGGTPSVSLSDASADTVTLDCGAGVQLNTLTAVSFIIALPPMTLDGGFTVTITDSEGKQMELATRKSQTITRSNLLKMPEVTYTGVARLNIPESVVVDLGLPSGLKWASFNIGATKPEEYGDYFAWGETVPKSYYGWSTYKWCNGSETSLTKYNTNSSYGAIDNKTVLDPEDDAAHVNWGGAWHIPTDADWKELEKNCTWAWTDNYNGTGVAGNIVTAKKTGYQDQSLFLPAAGFRSDAEHNGLGSYGCCWSSSLNEQSAPIHAYLYSYSSYIHRGGSYRCYGFSVRPVGYIIIDVTQISLDRSSADLKLGGSIQLQATISPSNASDKTINWESSNTAVATVSSNGWVKAVAAGNTTISAYASNGMKASCAVTVASPDNGQENGHYYVDMGLSVKWATCNVGATMPEEYGEYFAWGETEPKSDYNWATYKLCEGTYNTLTKYNDNSNYGIVDNKTVLDPEDDAAHVNWGGAWRMPTNDEWQALKDKCTWTWINQNGTLGRLVKSNITGEKIFLPAASTKNADGLIGGYDGYYWSSTLYGKDEAWGFHFWSNDYSRYPGQRSNGRSVRPVIE